MLSHNNIAPVVVLCGVLGIDTNSTSQSQMVAFCCAGIEDMWDFVAYVRDRHTAIEYAKPLQKLDQLSLAYKELQERAKNAQKYAKAAAWIQEIVDKCTECYHSIESERMGGFVDGKYKLGRECEWRHIYVDNKPYFSQKQLEALSRVGSFAYTVESLRMGTLIDKLTTAYEKALTPPKVSCAMSEHTQKLLRIAYDPRTKSTQKQTARSDTQTPVL